MAFIFTVLLGPCISFFWFARLENLLSFCMAVLVEVEVKLSEDSLIRRPIESLCLIKEDVAEASLMPV